MYLQPATSAADLSRYRCVIYAHPAIMTDATAELLRAYAHDGGTLIFGCRTGYKDARGHCYMRPMPGPVADLCGITVEEFTRIGPYQQAPSLRWEGQPEMDGLRADAFNDVLQVESDAVEIVATYGEDAGYYAGKPALTRRAFGNGAAYYYGAVFNAAAQAMIHRLELAEPLAERLTLPKDVEIAVREQRDGARIVFLLNYADTPQTIDVRQPASNLLTGDTLHGGVTMAPYDVLVLRYA